MPGGNATDRFDQKSLTTNFSGALSWGNCGLFAAAFDQGDNWGKQRFEPTNLRFCKSVFAIDGMLISLGSDISAIGNYADNRLTATNLFQVVGEEGGSAVVNREEIKRNRVSSLNLKEEDAWLVTPNTTGYYLPAGNDSLIVQSVEQNVPVSSGLQSELKSTRVTKAYINHGVKPKDKGYCFVVVPNTTPRKMEMLVKQLRKKRGLFEVLSTRDSVHVLRHHSSGTIAYSLFAPVSHLSYGCLRSSDTELLFMERMDKKKGTLDVALCNPNLRPQPSKAYGWIATPTYASLVLNGEWALVDVECSEKVLLIESKATATTIKVALSEGEPLYLKLEKRTSNDSFSVK